MTRTLSAAPIAVVLMWSAGVAPAPADAGMPAVIQKYRFETMTMGTYASVTIVAPDSAWAADAAHEAHAALWAVDSLMSNWTDTSEIARINRELGPSAIPVEPEVGDVIALALDVWQASQGAFDVTVEPLVRAWGFLGGRPAVPSPGDLRGALALVGSQHVDFDRVGRTIATDLPGVSIDLGGIAKGHGVDRAAGRLVARGVHDALVDVSGNMMALGHPMGRDAWVIGVRDPRGEVDYIARLSIRDRAIATSGAYEQFVVADGRTYGHILDPRTGWPADGLTSTTVLAPTAAEADAWSTAFFVLGLDGAREVLSENPELTVVLVAEDDDGREHVWISPSLADAFEPEPSLTGRFEVSTL